MKLNKLYIENHFDDGDMILFNKEEEKTIVLNETAVIVYNIIKENDGLSYDKLWEIVSQKYSSFPKKYYKDIILNLKNYGVIDD